MRIAYDGLCFNKRTTSIERGIGYYTLSMLNEFQHSDVSGVVMVPQLGINKDLLAGNIILADMQQTDPSISLQHAGALSAAFVMGYRPDCIHVLSPFEFMGYDPVIYHNLGLPVVATLFDLIPLVFKEIYLSDPKTYKLYTERLDFYKKCTRILAISRSSANDMERLLGIDSSRIDTLPPLLSRKSLRNNKRDLNTEPVSNEKYLFYTGGDEFRKNLSGLVEAVAEVKKAGIDDIKVKIVCRIRKEVVQALEKKATVLGAPGCVEFLGYVSDEELRDLYEKAYAFIFPSLYEGLGMPVIEALEYNLPILCSNNSSLPEVSGEAALYFSPTNIEEMAQKIYDIWTKTELRAKLARNSFEQYKKLQNNSVGNALLNSYNRAIDEHPSKNLKICMVSPMPPELSGVAEYASELAATMSGVTDITVVDSMTEESEARKKIRESDVCIFQMGNSGAHMFMGPLLDERCDLLVLHDVFLLGYWYYILAHVNNDPKALIDFVCKWEGNAAADYMRAVFGGQVSLELDRLQLNDPIVSKAKAILVHNQWAAEKIRQKHPWVHTLILPHPYPPPGTDTLPNVRKQYGIDDQCFLIGSYGIVWDTKMPREIIRSFASVIKQGINSKLVFVGPVDEEYRDELIELINHLGLSNLILFTGRVEKEEFINFLNAADCVVNLRTMYKGESSRTLAQALSSGKPAIVSNIGAFSEMPDDVVIKVNNQTVEGELTEAIIKIAQDESYKNMLSKSAISFAAKHNWTYGALRYIQIASMIASAEKFKEITSCYVNMPVYARDAERLWAEGANYYASQLI